MSQVLTGIIIYMFNLLSVNGPVHMTVEYSTEDNAHKVVALLIRLHTETSCEMIHLTTVCKGHMMVNEYDT